MTAAERAHASAVAQGFPAVIEDPATLARVAALLFPLPARPPDEDGEA